MGLDAADYLAFEDSANGLRAAGRAGLSRIMTRNAFTAHHDFTGPLRVLPSLEGATVADLRAWHAAAAR
jgi:beta-phosphoglucomutase-like phosphatase (HAD superfamily)